MPKVFHLEIEMENAAFEDSAPQEVARILERVAMRLILRNDFHVGEERPLLDINGNTVGKWIVTDRPPEST